MAAKFTIAVAVLISFCIFFSSPSQARVLSDNRFTRTISLSNPLPLASDTVAAIGVTRPFRFRPISRHFRHSHRRFQIPYGDDMILADGQRPSLHPVSYHLDQERDQTRFTNWLRHIFNRV